MIHQKAVGLHVDVHALLCPPYKTKLQEDDGGVTERGDIGPSKQCAEIQGMLTPKHTPELTTFERASAVLEI